MWLCESCVWPNGTGAPGECAHAPCADQCALPHANTEVTKTYTTQTLLISTSISHFYIVIVPENQEMFDITQPHCSERPHGPVSHMVRSVSWSGLMVRSHGLAQFKVIGPVTMTMSSDCLWTEKRHFSPTMHCTEGRGWRTKGRSPVDKRGQRGGASTLNKH